ncbi:MAG: nitroreductase family protein [Bacteroidales bacterium]
MDAIKMIKERRSVRKYKEHKVSRDTIKSIIDSARWAPSWANSQIARYTILENKELIQRIADEGVHGFSYNIGTLRNAPGVIVLSYVNGKSGKLYKKDGYATSKGNAWEMFDSGIACQTLCLAAHEHGVGTCIFGVFDDKVVSDIVSLPEGETVAAIITFGYPDQEVNPTPRLEVEEIIKFIE